MLVSFLSHFCSAADEMAGVFLFLFGDAGLNHVFCHQIWVRFLKANQDWPAYAPVGISESLDHVFWKDLSLTVMSTSKTSLFFCFLLYEGLFFLTISTCFQDNLISLLTPSVS